MNEKELEEYKKDYQEMKSKYTNDEIIENIFIAIRVLDKNVGLNITNQINVIFKSIVDLYERIEKLEKAVTSLLESEE